MKHSMRSRRQFLAGAGSSLGAAWMAANWPAIAAAHAHAAALATAPDASTLDFLNAEEARDVEAIAAQIIPTDDTPGAREAGALFFIDRSLHTLASSAAVPFRSGLRDFKSAFAARHPSSEFAAADSSTQIAFLTAVETSACWRNRTPPRCRSKRTACRSTLRSRMRGACRRCGAPTKPTRMI